MLNYASLVVCLSALAIAVSANPFVEPQSRHFITSCFGDGLEQCLSVVEKCAKDKDACYDTQSCIDCTEAARAQCKPCAEAIVSSETFPTGTYNRGFTCTPTKPDQVNMCRFYCKGMGFKYGQCFPATRLCYCSWDNRVSETFRPQLNNEEGGRLLELIDETMTAKYKAIYDTQDMTKTEGFTNEAFHAAVKGKTQTLTVVKLRSLNDANTYVFGGYTAAPWDSANPGPSDDPTAFTFSLVNWSNRPQKFPILDQDEGANAIYNNPNFGPTFGYDNGRYEFSINRNVSPKIPAKTGHANPGYTYDIDWIRPGSDSAFSLFAGKQNFEINRLAVYQKK